MNPNGWRPASLNSRFDLIFRFQGPFPSPFGGKDYLEEDIVLELAEELGFYVSWI
jgi:hypothetical protein